MTIIFIMNNILEKKLLYLKIKKYAKNLEGIQSFKISFIEDKDFVWFKKQMKFFFKIEQNNADIILEHDVSKKKVIQVIHNILKTNTGINCIQLFEEKIAVYLKIKNLDFFLNSVFKYNQCYDLSLLFLEPERIIIINDDEYKIYIHYSINN